MLAFLKKHYVHVIGGVVIVFLVLMTTGAIILGSLNSARSVPSYYGNDSEKTSFALRAPSAGFGQAESVAIDEFSRSHLPATDSYVPNLESYETTDYRLKGRTKEFEAMCDTLEWLKTDDRIHFKSISTSLNNCRATIFSEKGATADVLDQLTAYGGIAVDRTTQSVTRHREQIQSQSDIIRRQLQSVETTLTEAETAYDDIASFAKEQSDATAYASAINQKLQQIDQLTQRKISLTSRLDSLAQQAADLEERIGIDQISVNISRSYPLDPDRSTRAWEQAWEKLSDTWTAALIGITAYFAIFVLYVVQYSIYLVVLIVLARIFWKLLKRVWQW